MLKKLFTVLTLCLAIYVGQGMFTTPNICSAEQVRIVSGKTECLLGMPPTVDSDGTIAVKFASNSDGRWGSGIICFKQDKNGQWLCSDAVEENWSKVSTNQFANDVLYVALQYI